MSAARRFVSEVVLVGALFAATNLVSYVYLAMLGRQLSVREFGSFGALVGLLSIGGYVAGSIQIAVSKAFGAQWNPALAVGLRRWSVRTALIGAVVAVAVVVPTYGRLESTAAQVTVLVLAVAAMLYSSCITGLMIAAGGNVAQSAAGLAGAMMRLSSGALLLVLGAGAAGGLSAYLINYLAIALIGEWYLARRTASGGVSWWAPASVSPSLPWAPMIAYVCTFAPFALDQFMAQWLAPEVSGKYTALATIAKLVFFGLYPLILVVYSHLLRAPAGGFALVLLARAIAGLLVLAMMLVAAIAGTSEWIVRAFYGDRYHEIVEWLVLQAGSIAVFTLSVMAVHGWIARDSRGAARVAVVASLPPMVMYLLIDASLGRLAEIQSWIYGVQMATFLGGLGFALRRQRRIDANAATLSR